MVVIKESDGESLTVGQYLEQMLGHLGEKDSKIDPMSAIRITVTSYCHIAKALYTLLRPIDVRDTKY